MLTDEGMEIVEDSPDESLDLFMFVDANYAISTSHRDSPSVPHRAFAANGADGTTSNGFSLEWMGLDASYDGGEVGATASLRFGDGVPTYFGNRSDSGIANLTQAYVTWVPHERITLNLGQFTTIYGAEVAESFRNLNYTRGGLYYMMQPAWHTGLKGGFAITDGFGINALVVNGVNSTFDEDDALDVLPLHLAHQLRIGEVLTLLLRIHHLEQDHRNQEEKHPERGHLGEAAPAGVLRSIRVAVSHVYFFRETAVRRRGGAAPCPASEARDERQVPEILRMVQPVSDQELVGSIEPHPARLQLQLRGQTLVQQSHHLE